VEPSQSAARALIPKGGRVVILRALPGIGDLLCVTPALRALREHRPDVEMTYLGLPGTEALVSRYRHLVDHFVPFPGYPGLPEQPWDASRFEAFLGDMRAARFDLAIQLHGSGAVTNEVIDLLGARHVAGHAAAGDPRLEPIHHVAAAADGDSTRTFLPWSESTHEIRRGLRLMAHLGWPSEDDRPEFVVAPWTGSPRVDGRYVVVHPGASAATRRWSATGFREVAASLARSGLRVVLTGTVEDGPRNRAIAEQLPDDTIDLSGRTTLDELGALLGGSRLLISNDTGVAHLAVALDVPSVVVFTGSVDERWAPLDRARHAAVRGAADDVLAAARRLLAPEGARHAA
jgi:ADP-heptose:LPS heptosyltransferase